MIRHISGDIIKTGGTPSNILSELGITLTPLDVANDGRGQTVSAIVIDGKQYALGDALAKVKDSLSGGLCVKYTGTTPTSSHTFAEMKDKDPLTITWDGNPAAEITYTKSSGVITQIHAKFLTIDTTNNTLKVTTVTAKSTSSSLTKSSKTYELTAAT